MKTFAIIQKTAIILLLSLLFFVSCDYLDIVPPEQATLKDATKDYDATLRFLYSCYSGLNSDYLFDYTAVESASDEWVLPPLRSDFMHKMTTGRVVPQNVALWVWGRLYASIGQCHLFLNQLESAQGVSEEDKREWRAEAEFMVAYYHMKVLSLYGPCPINKEYLPMGADPSEYPGRSHFDFVTDWIVNKFDEVAENLPAQREQEKWGRATSTMAKALKSRLLVYAASPLWNGNFPYPEWKNKNFETPGYGKDLVSTEYDARKWERAKQASLEALDWAINKGGISLYIDENYHERQGVPLPYVPNVDAETEDGKSFLKKVLLMRYLVATRPTEGNKEVIWGMANQGNIIMGSLPHFILQHNNGTTISGQSSISPILNTSIEYFYTKTGKRPAFDNEFTPKNMWFKSAGINTRMDIINLNVNREPRFYAWFAFDGGDYGSKIANGEPLRIELRNADKQGYNPNKYNKDNNVTGYFSQKYVQPNLSISKNGTWSNNQTNPRPLIRLAELYLNLAECYAALGETDNAIKQLNVIRKRAGVPELKTADLNQQMNIMDWVRNERFIELWGEGHRYYDIRRWMIAPETMGSGMRMGLNAYGTISPSFEEFNTPKQVDQPFLWTNKMYLLPLFYIEVYKNPQMMQSPGY
jgi:hypothetical protein